ncbi:MAG: PAS domain S-box protein [Anaerolineae bacterium]|nr:PAS domain S-box protein [Anaerolineae bacterium]
MTPSRDAYREVFEAAGDGLIISDVETGRVVDANSLAGAMHGYAREDFIGLSSASYITPSGERQFLADLQAIRPGDVFEALSVHQRRDKTQFFAEERRSALTHGDRACLMSVVRDISQRVESEQYLLEEVETRTREQATLLEVSQTLASALQLKPGLILDQLRAILDYSQAGLFALEGSDLVPLAVRGPLPLEQAVPFRIRMNGPETLTALFPDNAPIRIADVSGADSAAQYLRSFLENQAAMLLAGMRAWMWVPVAVKSEVIGAIGVAHNELDYFTDHHANLALIVANQAAITMVNADLYEHAQALAVLRERQRLAQDLHDAVNQSLFSAGLIAEVLPRLWDRDNAQGRESLDDLRRLIRGALAEMRILLVELRPTALTDSDLADLLRLLASALTGRAKIPVTVSVTGKGALPAEAQVAFYRLCQEGLNNVAKHSKAKRVDIKLQYGPADGAVELRIHDDGRGFDPASIRSGHYGLSIMRERADAVGAVLSIESRPGQGADLAMRWAPAPKQEVA